MSEQGEKKLLSELGGAYLGKSYYRPDPRLYFSKEFTSGRNRIYLACGVTRMVGVDAVMVPHEEGAPFEDHLVELSDRHTQELFDQLWAAGFRPPGQQYSDATLNAVTHNRDFAEVLVKGMARKLGVEV